MLLSVDQRTVTSIEVPILTDGGEEHVVQEEGDGYDD